MQLTTEQQKQVREAQAKNEQRMVTQFTAEQKQEWQEAVAQELEGKAANIAYIRKVQSAAEQPGFFGDIRRAILLSSRKPVELASAIGVDPHLLADFRSGDCDLPSTALDRLVESLGLRLMQEIPH